MDSGDRMRIGDRRKAQRYPVALPIEFDDGTGTTRNMSTTGVRFETDRALVPGALVRFRLTMEEEDVPTRLRCEGTVVIAERHETIWEVAVQIDSFRFDGPA
jgi:choline dehydrogenase-like flavoprotein